MASNVSFDFNGKVALVTGASSGIGRGIALMFAKSGANLALAGRNNEQLNKTAKMCEELNSKTKTLAIVGDLTLQNDVKTLLDSTIDHFKQLDILVNNAGAIVFGTCEETSIEDFDQMIKINIRSAFLVTKLAIPYLVKTEGCIVNMSSLGSSRPQSGFNAYCTSKAALDQFTRACAVELGPKNVRVNSVNPSVIMTPELSSSSDPALKNALERSKETHALQRTGTVEEVAGVVLFLASGASTFITGANIPVDGGRGSMVNV